MSEIKDEIVDETVDEVIVEDTQVEATADLDIPEAPLTAARTVSAIQASLAEMSKEGLDEIFEAAEKAKAKAKVEAEDDEDEDEDDDEDEGEVEETGKKAKKESKTKKESKKSVKEIDDVDSQETGGKTDQPDNKGDKIKKKKAWISFAKREDRRSILQGIFRIW